MIRPDVDIRLVDRAIHRNSPVESKPSKAAALRQCGTTVAGIPVIIHMGKYVQMCVRVCFIRKMACNRASRHWTKKAHPERVELLRAPRHRPTTPRRPDSICSSKPLAGALLSEPHHDRGVGRRKSHLSLRPLDAM